MFCIGLHSCHHTASLPRRNDTYLVHIERKINQVQHSGITHLLKGIIFPNTFYIEDRLSLQCSASFFATPITISIPSLKLSHRPLPAHLLLLSLHRSNRWLLAQLCLCLLPAHFRQAAEQLFTEMLDQFPLLRVRNFYLRHLYTTINSLLVTQTVKLARRLYL